MHLPRVLVVDDDACQRRMFSRCLGHLGCQVVTASSAEQALGLLGGCQPQVLLVDIDMPFISGIEFLQLLRANPVNARLPAILITGLRVPPEMVVAAAKGLGVERIHIKGEDLGALAKDIRALAELGRQEAFPAHVLKKGRLIADPESHKARFGDAPIQLHGWRAFDLLCAFMRAEEPLSRRALHRSFWAESESSGVVSVNIMRLRRDLAVFPSIRILAGSSGYRLLVD